MLWISVGFYIAAVLGAVAVFLALPHRRSMPKLGALLGVATLAGLGVAVGVYLDRPEQLPGWYFYIFALISAAAALRVITHTRPVYAALYFVIVVLSSAGMMVLLRAEFMAFAMVIIYGGAILVTYMFVIMLATLPRTEDRPETGADYDNTAREPLAAVAMGFVLLAALSSAIFNPAALESPGVEVIPRQSEEAAWERSKASLRILAGKIDLEIETHRRRLAAALRETGRIGPDEFVQSIDVSEVAVGVAQGAPRGTRGSVGYVRAPGTRVRSVPLTIADAPVLREFIGNIDYVGLSLFRSHTLGIELAGVILLLAMVGAIVIARRKVPEVEARVW